MKKDKKEKIQKEKEERKQNLKDILIKYLFRGGVLAFLLYLPHFVKNMVVSFFHLEKLINMPLSLRVFNKITAFEVFIVLGIIFFLYNKELLGKLKFEKFNFFKSFLFLVIGYIFVIYYYASQVFVNYYKIYSGLPAIAIVISQFIALFLYAVFVIFSVFGFGFIKELYKMTFPQFWLFGFGQIIFTILISLFEKAWFYFSGAVAKIITFLLSPFYDLRLNFLNKTPIITIEGFTVSIGPPCSGISSLLLFSAFYAVLIGIDYKIIHRGRAIFFFIIGLIGDFFVNVVRIALLLLAGIYISPEFSVGLFHTNAGWVLFVGYFILYYYFIKRYLYVKNYNT